MKIVLLRLLAVITLLCLGSAAGRAAEVTASYTTGTEVPVTAAGYTATGNTVTFSLNYAPTPGTELTVVRNTGLGFINGRFDNLAHGQVVPLTFDGTTYQFVANYHGGQYGRDLVLVWAKNRTFAWGAKFALGAVQAREVPVPVDATGVLADKTIVAVAAGLNHSLALCADGTVASWGSNKDGALGDSTTTDQRYPVGVNRSALLGSALAGKTVVAISAGDSHSLALCSDGTVLAWGDNTAGQLGIGGTDAKRILPTAVNSLTTGGFLAGKLVVAIAAGSRHSLALISDGTLAVWGDNNTGQLGDGSKTSRRLPVAVSRAADESSLFNRRVLAIAAGNGHSVVLCTDGTLHSWGNNNYGQLGQLDPATTTASASTTSTSTGSPQSIYKTKTFGFETEGGKYAHVELPTGFNPDALKTTTTTTVKVTTSTTTTTGRLYPGILLLSDPLYAKVPISVHAGDRHSLALFSDGTVASWGDNSSGQLGSGSKKQRKAPGLVSSASGLSFLNGKVPVVLGIGRDFTTAILSDGTAAAWGINENGELGDDTLTNRLYAVAVATNRLGFGERFLKVTSSPNTHSLAIVASPVLPEMFVLGNGLVIPSGTNAALADNPTDFGATTASSPVTRTFTITNGGPAKLNLTGTPKVVVTGVNASDFAVTVPPASPVPGLGGVASFQIKFTPGGIGTRRAQVAISSNDPDNAPYAFLIKGTGPVADLKITESGTAITPQGFASFGFASTAVPSALTFQIQNAGNAVLNLSGVPKVAISGEAASDFVVATQPPAAVPIGGTASFQIVFAPVEPGFRRAVVSLESDDDRKSPFTFTVIGFGPPPQIGALGNSVPILKGDATPDRADFTELGMSPVGVPLVRTFSITNAGLGNLRLPAGGGVTLSGPDAARFSVVQQPVNSLVPPGGTATFQMSFTPVSERVVSTATVSIDSDDTRNNPFNFSVAGLGPAPAARISGNGVLIANGDLVPDVADHTDFGTSAVGVPVTRTFTLRNEGLQPLLLTGNPRVVLSGANAAEFSVTQTPGSPIAVSGSTPFQITFTPAGIGVRRALCTILSDDPRAGSYTFGIQGAGPAPVLSVNEDSPGVDVDLNNLFSVSAGILTYAVTRNSSPDLVTTAVLSAQLRLVPIRNRNGSCEVDVVGSRAGAPDTALTFIINVKPVNDPPDFVAPPGVNIPLGETLTKLTASLTSVNRFVVSADGLNLVSANGSSLSASGFQRSRLHYSLDGGTNWSASGGISDDILKLAGSADGRKLVAVRASYLTSVVPVSSAPNAIFTSIDFGQSWVQQTAAPNQGWLSVASSLDGVKLVATCGPSTPGVQPVVFRSTDSGATWTSVATTASFNNVLGFITSSADGSKLAVVAGGFLGSIYTSDNSGTTWRLSGGSFTNVSRLVSSPDGQKLTVIERGGNIITSQDGGQTWVRRVSAGLRDWLDIAMSTDGTTLAATAYDFSSRKGRIYVSLDSGQTWTQRGQEATWNAIACSADGNRLFVGGPDGVYTSVGANKPFTISVASDSGPHRSPNLVTGIQPGPADEAGQTVQFTATNDNYVLFSTQPAVSTDGTLTFVPHPLQGGKAIVSLIATDDGSTADGGMNTSLPKTFVIEVIRAPNRQPTVTLAAGAIRWPNGGGSYLAGAGFASFNPGATYETNQVLTGHRVVNDFADLFAVQPSINQSGTLAFVPAANARGTANVTVVSQDSGGTADGGVDATTNKFTISITSANSAPRPTFANFRVTVTKEAPAQSLPGFATFSPGPDADAGQALLGYTLTTDNSALFSAGPAIDLFGRLTFTPAGGATGTAAVTVVTQDDGGTAGLGVDRSTNHFTIEVKDPTGLLIVTTTADSGPGSLRQNILNANASGVPSTILFLNNLGTLTPTPPLPDISVPVTISGGVGNTLNGTVIVGAAGALSLGDSKLPGGHVMTRAGGRFVGSGVLADDLFISSGGFSSPGSSPGNQVANNIYFEPGGTYEWEINDATGNAGTASDLLLARNTLNLTATTNSPFTIRLKTLTAANAAGAMPNFNPANGYAWTIAACLPITGSGPSTGPQLLGFDDFNKVTLDTNGFANPTLGGRFSLLVVGDVLYLVFDPNAAPEAFADAYTVQRGQTLNLVATNGVLTNDFDPYLDAITVAAGSVTAPTAGGSVTVNADGSFTYTPPSPTFTGEDTFTYRVTDGALTSEPATVKVVVLGPNVAPSFALGFNRVSTLAGTNTSGSANGSGSAAKFFNPHHVAVDDAGNVYVADTGNHRIRKITPAGVVTTLAGNTLGFADGTGTAARFDNPAGVTVDDAGNVYVADTGTFTGSGRNVVDYAGHRVRKVTPAGKVTTVAGGGPGLNTDGTGDEASFSLPTGVALDSRGNLLVVERINDRLRKVIMPQGVVTTLAGFSNGYADGTGSAALFNDPTGVAVDSAGNVYVADLLNDRIRKVTPAGVVTTLAGSTRGFADGTGTAARFNKPYGVAVDSAGNVLVADSENHRIRKVTPAGVVTTLSGSTAGFADGIGTAAQFNYPYGLAVDSAGNVYVGDRDNNRIRKMTPGEMTVSEDAGPLSIADLALSISPGPALEVAAGQTVTFEVSHNNAALFDVAPAINTNGTFTFTSATNAFGTATITVVAMDDGGTANGGVDKRTNTFQLTINSVNDAPSFSLATNRIVMAKTSSVITSNAFAFSFSPGPANESSQTLVGYTVTTDNTALFASGKGPKIDATGKLTFTPKTGATVGLATVSVVAQDSGGTSNGGVDKRTDTFQIALVDKNTAPSFHIPVDLITAGAAPETVKQVVIGPGTSVCMSSNGLVIAVTEVSDPKLATPLGGPLLVSTNGGLDFVERDVRRNWQAVVCSADGKRLLAADSGTNGPGGNLYTSDNFGVTWTARAGPGIKKWAALASSHSGTNLVAAVKGGQIYVSTDAGATWTAKETARDWASVASSADGSRLAAVVKSDPTITLGGNIYISIDSGKTWTPRAGAARWQSIASSADGLKLVAAEVGISLLGSVWTSADGGTNWTPQDSAGTHAWIGVASSYDGQRLFASYTAGSVGETGFVISTNGAAAWTPSPFNRSWGRLACSADGGRFVSFSASGVVTVSSPVVVVDENSGPATVTGAVANILPGLPQESYQTVAFTTTNSNNALFSSQPAIAPDGTLTFTPALNANGNAFLGVFAQDNGGTVGGGIDTSAQQPLTIVIRPVPKITKVVGQGSNRFGVSSVIRFSVTYDKFVTVTGTPQMGIKIGSTTVAANYVVGRSPSTNVLVFEYVVQAGQNDSDGVEVATPLVLNGGSIQDSSSGAKASLTFTSPAPSTTPRVDTTPPVVTISAPSHDTVNSGPGNSVTFTVTIAEESPQTLVHIFSTPPGSGSPPGFRLNKTGTANGTVTYVRVPSTTPTASGGSTVASTVIVTNLTGTGTLGLSIDADSIANDNLHGNAPAGPSATFEVVSTPPPAPAITSVVPPANSTNRVGHPLDFTVIFSAVVNVTGKPQLTLDVGGTARSATYVSGSGSTSLRFSYTVLAGDNDLDGIVLASPVSLSGGTIKSTAPVDALLTFAPPVLPDMPNVKVDTTKPTLTISAPSLASTSTGPVTYTLTYADNMAVAAIDLLRGDPINLNKTGDANGTFAISGTGNTRTLTISDITGTGTLSISVRPGTAGDFAGNGAPAAGPSTAFNVVNSGAQTITFAQPNGIIYGDVAVTNLTATASSGLPVAFEILSGPGTLSDGTNVTITGAGTIRIKATQPGDTMVGAAEPVIREFIVGKKALTVIAANATRAYGQPNPNFTVSFTGFVGTDTVAQLAGDGAAGISTTATSTSAPGTYPITPTLGSLGADNYTFGTFTEGTLTVTKATATVTLADLAHVYSGSEKSASATTLPAGLPVNLSYTGARINAGNYPVTATIADANYQGTASDMLVIAKAPQTITFAPPPSSVPLKDLSTVALAATSSSGLTVTLTLDAGGAATLNNTAGSYSLSSIGMTGTITLRANQPGDDNYLPATEVVRTLNVEKNNQTITFAALVDKVFGNAAFTLAATADSALAVTYTVVSGPATVSGDQLTITGTGEVKVRASQAGDTAFNPAADVDRTFTVGKANQTITFADFTGATYGDAALMLGATADSTLAVTYTVLSGPATVSGSTLTITGAGEVIVQASQPGNANYSAATSVSKTLTVAKKALTATVANATRQVGAADPAFTVNYTGLVGTDTKAVLDIQPTVTTTATSASPVGTYPLTAAGGVDANYSFSYVAGTLTIGLTPQTITFAQPADQILGGTPLTLAATASSGLPVSYTVVSGPAVLGGNVLSFSGTGAVTVRATQAGNGTFAAATDVDVTFNVVAPPNTAPTGLSLSGQSILENRPAGTTVATLTARDGNLADTHTFSLVSGFGDIDNAAFTIVGNELRTTAPLDFETTNYLVVRLRVTDNGGLFFNQAVSFTVVDVNEAPVVTLAQSSLRVNQNSGTFSLAAFASFANGPAPEAGQSLLGYTVTVDSPALFSAAPALTASGKLTFTPAVNATGTATVTVTARDTGGTANGGVDTSAARTFTVNVVTPPAVFSVTPATGSFRMGQTVTVTVAFTAPVTLTGTMELPLTVGSTARVATGTTVTDGTNVVFSYVVQAGDTDLDGLTLASPLTLASGTLRDATGVDALLNFTPPATTGVLVDTTVPTVTISAPSVANTMGGPVTFTVTYVDGAFNASTLSGADLTLNRTGDANGTVTVAGSGNTRTVSISGITGNGTLGISLAAGTASDLAGNLAPAAGPSATFTVFNFLPQAITFGALPGKTYGDAAFALGATASSSLPVSYTVSGPATVSGGTLTITGAGTVIVRASQPGDATFSAATSVEQSFVVAKKALTVTAGNAMRGYGVANPSFTATLAGFVNSDTAAVVSGVAGLSSTATTTSAPGNYDITPSVGSLSAANYTFATFTAGTLTVSKATATVTLTELAHTYNGSVKSAVAVTQPAGLTVNLGYTGARINAGSYAVTAVIADANYEGSASDTLVIAKAAQTITFAPPRNQVPLKELVSSPLAATASSSLPVTLTLDAGSAATLTGAPGSYSLTGIGQTGTVTLRANQPGDANYLPAVEVVRLVDVTKNNQIITFPAVSAKTFGDADVTLGATSDSALAVNYLLVSGPAILNNGVLKLTGAGEVRVRASQPGNSTFNAAADVEIAFTVGKASQTITFGAFAAATYGDANLTLAASASSGLGLTYSVVSGPATVTGGVLTITGAGSVVVQASQPGNENYTAATTVSQTLTVAKKTLTVTVANASRAVGAPDPTFTVSYAGFVRGDTAAVLDVPPTVTSGANSTSVAGNYPLTAAGGADNNYDFSYVAGSLAVNQSSQTITFGTLAGKTYGDAPVVLAATSSSGQSVTYRVVSGNATVSGNTLTLTGAGEVVVEATQAGNDTFSAAAPVTQNFTVAKKALTVVAQDARRAFGQANPPFTASYNGFVGTDTTTALGGAPGLGTTADSASAPGTYPITPTLGSLSAANYTFAAFTPGTLTVTKATATVTLADLAHVYSGSAKSATATTQPAGLTVNLSYTGARINAGSYPVTATIADANYEGFVSDTLVIAKAPQTITFAPPASAVPLKDLSTLALAATASSTLPVTLTLEPGSAATLAGTSGNYSLTGIGATGTVTLRANQPGDDNYLPATEVLRTLDVTKNNQTITFAALPGKIFGDQPITLGATADSSLAVSYTVLSGSATVSGNVLTITGAGDVVVRASQSGNPIFNAAADVERTFTVGKAPQTILFGPLAEVTYGDAPITLAASVNSPLTVTYNVTGPATVNGNTLTLTGAGSVVVQAVQGGNENYSLATPVTQTLTVAKRELTVTVANAARAVGAPDPQFTVSYTGFAGSETEAVLDTPPTVTSTANSASPAGTYPLTAAGGVDNNYRFTYVAGSLVLSQTPQDITFGTLPNRTYGDAPVVLTATSSSGQPVSYTVSGPATVSGNVLTITGAGIVEVVANQSGNVAFSAAASVTQTFSVAKKALVVTAANAARAYGVANPAFTAALAGFVNGDTFAVVSGTPAFTTSATSASEPGGYPITVGVGTLVAANYSFDTFVPATLTVTKATATVTLAGLAHTYDGTPKAATATTDPAGLTVNVTYAPGTPLNAGSYTVTATLVNSRYEGSTTGTLVVSKAAQVITFAAPPSNVPLKDLTTVGLTATSSSGLSVTLTLDAGSAATLVGSPGNYALTGLGAAGPVTLRANQPGNDNYLPATEVVRALDVTRNNQTITFAALAGKTFGDAPITLAATADSSLPVSFSLVSGPATLVGNVLSFTGAGEVRVRASQPGNASFNAAADVDRTFTVAKAPQAISFASLAARTYGAAAVTLSAAADSGLPVSFSIVSGPANLNGNVLTLTGAGNVVVQASQGGDANYLVATAVQRTLVVGKKVLTVTATDATRRVGAANPTFTFTATGYVGTDTAGVLDTPPTVTTTATATSAAGDYPLTASGGADDSYEFAYAAGKLVITQVPQTITFNALPGKTYGDATVTLTATANSGLAVTYTIVSGPGTLSGGVLTLTGAGTIVVQAAQAGDTTNAAAASVTQELVVAKKALVVGVQDEQRSYGQPNPGFTATYTGFVSPDTAAVLNGSAGFTTTATATSAPGTYPITPSVGSLSSTNYAFATFNPGTLTVSKAAATVTLADLVHTYSGTAKSATATTVPAGLTVNLVQTGARVDAGNYPVTATIADANYEGSATDTLLISPASQIITYAPLPSSVPLKDLASVVLGATASSGLPVTLTLDGGSAATLSGTVGNYSLTAIGQTGTVTLRANQAGNGNYFAAEEVVRTLDVTKNNQAITFGTLPGVVFGAQPITLAATSDSGLTVTYEIVSGPATVTDNVLTITGSGDVIVRAKQAGNGTFNAAADVERTFTVGKANQTITFAAFTGATYGDAAITLGATADSSLAVTYTVVSGPATLSSGVLTFTGAGDVVVQATQLGNDNYSAASAVTRTLTIAKKGLTATVADAARQVGAADPTFTITYAGFITGDNELGLDTPPTVTSAANSASAAGDYALTAAGGADDNYSFTYVAGKLVISQVPQTITFGTIATRTFGDPLLVLAATASSGLPVSYSVVSGPATVSGSEIAITAPGVVTLRATQTGNITYSAATAVEQTFTVNPPPNSPPTAVSLFGASVLENLPAGTVAGTLTATDPNAGDTHTFTLVSGAGDADNATFSIVGNELRTVGAFNFEAKSSYTLRVRATDAGGLTIEQTFTITVLDVNEAPVAANNSHTMNQGDTLTVPIAAGVLANDSDPDQDALTATLVATTAQGTLRLNPNGSFTYTPASSFFGTDAFTYRATDGALNSATVTVNLSVIARPTNAVPSAQFTQKVFSGAILRFSATNLPTANALLVGDPDSTTLTVSLTVTNGTLLISQVNGLLFANGQTNGTNLILSGLTADVNAALESLAYTSKTNYFGDDTLLIVTTDEGGRTNRSGGTVSILVEIPTLGGVPKVSLEGLNDTMTGRMITNVTGLVMDPNLVQGITYDLINSVVNVLPVGGQDGSTNRSTITVRVRFNDGTVEDVVVPVIIYQPLLTSVSGDATYAPTFGTPVFNPQTSLYEQKVSVQNNTPFDFTALRITATNLAAGVTLRNATLTNGGFTYIDYNLPVRSGSNVTLTLEYFNANRAGTFTPGLKLELLNSTRVVTPPTNPVMTAVTGLRGYAPDGRTRFYIEFPTLAGLTYYVQYKDAVGDPWKTSPVIIPGTGNRLNWLDDGAPNTDSPPTAARFYRIVTGQ